MSEIKGPLGLWHFPLLNFLRDFLRKFREKNVGESLSTRAENIERWKVKRLPSGGIDELIIHREVKE